MPANAYYFNLRPRLDKPSSGTGYAWFDDLRLVEWEPWQAAALPLDVSFPSNLRFLQVRFGSGAADSARVVWEERTAEGAPATVAEGLPADRATGGGIPTRGGADRIRSGRGRRSRTACRGPRMCDSRSSMSRGAVSPSWTRAGGTRAATTWRGRPVEHRPGPTSAACASTGKPARAS